MSRENSAAWQKSAIHGPDANEVTHGANFGRSTASLRADSERRRWQSTLATAASAAVDLQRFHFNDQRWVRREHAAGAVAELGWDGQAVLRVYRHQRH